MIHDHKTAVGAGRPGEGAQVQFVEVFTQLVPGGAGGGLGDAAQ